MQQQHGPMDKKAFEREAKQRMAFQLYTLQEFWRNLGLKNIPPGTLNSIISQTKAELNADWLSVTPQSLRDMVVRHRRLLVLKSKSQSKEDVQQPNKTDSDTVETENHKDSTTKSSPIREDAKTVEPVTDKLDPPSSETGALTTEEPITLPEREATIRAKLQKCIEVLNETMKGTPAYLPTSKLAKKLQKISDFMMGVVQSKGEHGSKLGKPAALHVCGGPGAGKTMGVTNCKRQMIAWAKDNLEAWQEMPVFCHFHGSSFQQHCTSKSAAMKALRAGISNEIGKAFNEDRMLKRRSKSDEKKTALILIIDEIDFLVSERLVDDRLVSSEDFLQTVLKWANDDQMAFALIGISNSVANVRGRRLQELGQFEDNLVFETYATNDLIHMVDCRIGRTIVDPKVVEFFAKRVAATSGDARKLLDLIAKAVSKCKEQLPCYRLESSEEAGIVVKMPDAMTALRESVNPKYTTLIKGLPSTRRAVLCVAVTSARSRRKESNQLTLGELRRYCVDAFGEDIELDADGFKDAIEALSDTGLLLLAKPDKKRFLVEPVSGLSMVPIRLELQLEDVENAVESELLDTGFYHRLVRSLL